MSLRTELLLVAALTFGLVAQAAAQAGPSVQAAGNSDAPFSHDEGVAMVQQFTARLEEAAGREAQLSANMGLLLARLQAETARADAAEKRADQEKARADALQAKLAAQTAPGHS